MEERQRKRMGIIFTKICISLAICKVNNPPPFCITKGEGGVFRVGLGPAINHLGKFLDLCNQDSKI